MRLSVPAAAAALALVTPASAQVPPADPPLRLVLDRAATGWIAASVSGAPGDRVTLAEPGARTAAEPVGVLLDAAGAARIPRLAPWLCDLRARRFTASDDRGRTASATVATPGCDGRLRLSLSTTRLRARRSVTVTVQDTWRTGGLRFSVCRRAVGGRASCQRHALRDGQTRRTSRLRMPRSGRWTIELRRTRRVAARELLVRPSTGRLRVLAAGDSMIQVVDVHLERRLGSAARVRTDDHISTGISKPFMLNWPIRARETSRAFKPDATVVFLGANDGFPMRDARGRRLACCGEEWLAEYARRASRMIRSYSRGGAAMTYWLLLPTPRSATFRRVFRAVNAGVVRAGRLNPGLVRVVDLRRVFTPGGRFRATMRWRGRAVRVRQEDGVHLSGAGAAIAAEVIVRALRRDGLAR